MHRQCLADCNSAYRATPKPFKTPFPRKTPTPLRPPHGAKIKNVGSTLPPNPLLPHGVKIKNDRSTLYRVVKGIPKLAKGVPDGKYFGAMSEFMLIFGYKGETYFALGQFCLRQIDPAPRILTIRNSKIVEDVSVSSEPARTIRVRSRV
uniref:Uncharacterized protein n=1 Tax=Marseillevirus LCMAC103 TaxID=2506604 RepID=A0A481YV99_9VIRU|nr:MAG: hypothetical protein LCMAC103_00440 [Marseillevirus LCMAC103]